MSEAKHTPGPWKFILGGSGSWPTWTVQIGEPPRFVSIPIGPDMETMDADARLIAAAPELLEVADMLLANLVSDRGCMGRNPEDDARVKLARAAIAKATGVQP